LRHEAVHTIVVDTEPGGSAGGESNCREMAALSGGKYLTLSRLTRRTLEQTLGN